MKMFGKLLKWSAANVQLGEMKKKGLGNRSELRLAEAHSLELQHRIHNRPLLVREGAPQDLWVKAIVLHQVLGIVVLQGDGTDLHDRGQIVVLAVDYHVKVESTWNE